MRVAPLVLASLASVLLSCGGDDTRTPAPARAPVSLVSSVYTVRIDLDAREVVLDRGGAVLLRIPAEGLALGARDTVDDATSYDPYPIFVPEGVTPYPDDLVWLQPERFDLVAADGTSIEVDVTYPRATRARLRIELGKSTGAFKATLTPKEGEAALAYVRVAPRVDAEEGLYGLGEHFDDVNNRGHVRAMQIEVDGEIESNYNEVHVPIPLLVGTRGWGLFVDTPYPAVFGVATEAPDVVDAIVGTGLATSAGLTFHLFGAEHPLDVTKHYYDLTGTPRLPARWALGPWIWRDENRDQAEVESDVKAIREFDLATSGYWIDRPYATAVNTFDFDAERFPDPKAMIALAHEHGLRVALWHVPYLDEKDPATKTLRDEAKAKGYYPPASGLNLNKWGTLLDLTNEGAFAWWQGLVRKYTDPTTGLAIEGFKLDYAEDVVPGLIGGARNVWKFADGSDERTMHGRFQLFYHRLYAETLPEEGGFLLCRHATIGDQTNGPIIWPGDLDADFSKHREEVVGKDGKKYVAVGGLPASLIAGLTLGPSGFPFYGADTGGYRHSPPKKEVLVRWFEQTALSTVMQVGNSANTVPWEPDPETGVDGETLDLYRRYARLHMRLFPYEWTYARNLAVDGRPIQRALGLAHPELGVHPNDEYLFGDHLLVAPVVEGGKVERQVIFPAGRWIDWWTGEVHEAGTKVVPAPLDTLPLYLREGGTVPLLRPTIDTLAVATSPAVDSFGNDPGVLWARVAPGPELATFVVYDGARIEHRRNGSTIELRSSDGSEFAKGVVFELVGVGKPTSVKDASLELPEVTDLDAEPTGFAWTADANGTLRVKVPTGTHTVTVTLP